MVVIYVQRILKLTTDRTSPGLRFVHLSVFRQLEAVAVSQLLLTAQTWIGATLQASALVTSTGVLLSGWS